MTKVHERYALWFYQLMLKERERQDELHLEKNMNKALAEWATVLGEEYGEICQAIQNKDMDNLRDELVQVASVCLSIYQRILDKGGFME